MEVHTSETPSADLPESDIQRSQVQEDLSESVPVSEVYEESTVKRKDVIITEHRSDPPEKLPRSGVFESTTEKTDVASLNLPQSNISQKDSESEDEKVVSDFDINVK